MIGTDFQLSYTPLTGIKALVEHHQVRYVRLISFEHIQ